jgi:hypothetical protein
MKYAIGKRVKEFLTLMTEEGCAGSLEKSKMDSVHAAPERISPVDTFILAD